MTNDASGARLSWPEHLARTGAIRFSRSSAHYDPTVAFYRDVLGLPLIGEFTESFGEDGTIFGLPGLPIHLEIVRARGPAPEVDPLDQLVFYLSGAAAVAVATARLQGAGVPRTRRRTRTGRPAVGSRSSTRTAGASYSLPGSSARRKSPARTAPEPCSASAEAGAQRGEPARRGGRLVVVAAAGGVRRVPLGGLLRGGRGAAEVRGQPPAVVGPGGLVGVAALRLVEQLPPWRPGCGAAATAPSPPARGRSARRGGR